MRPACGWRWLATLRGAAGTAAVALPLAVGASHTVTTTVVPNPCNAQCVAQATAGVAGGSGSFAFQWSTVPAQTGATATGLCSGTYVVVVTDLINGDQVPTFAIVVDPPPIGIQFATTPATCGGTCGGTSTATALGGTPGYLYRWDDGSVTATATGLCAGLRSLTVTDANACQRTQSTVVTEPPPLSLAVSTLPASAPHLCDGSALAIAGGGAPPYGYAWTPQGATTARADGLCPGTHAVALRDVAGCTLARTGVTIDALAAEPVAIPVLHGPLAMAWASLALGLLGAGAIRRATRDPGNGHRPR